MKPYLFDTNVLNEFLNREVAPVSIPRGMRCFVTAVQLGELAATKNVNRRTELLRHFEVLEDAVPIGKESLRSAPLGASPLGSAPLGGGDGVYYSPIKERLDTISGNKSKRGNSSDALTLEASIYAETVLVTNGRSLTKVAKERGVETLSFDGFMAQANQQMDKIDGMDIV